MTEDRLLQIEALLEAATPGPWSVTVTREDDTSEFHDPLVPPVRWDWEIGTEDSVVIDGIEYGRPEVDPSANLAFIAASPAIVAELLAEVKRLREDLDRAQLASIEARNPGIDMDAVRHFRSTGKLP
jgi:hypothetical protein